MHSPPHRKLVPLLVALFIAAVVAWALVYWRADTTGRGALELEAAKSLLQLMGVAVIGNVVLLLVRDYEDRKKAWIARRDLVRTDLTQELGELYGKTKKLRRLLRAAIDSKNGTIAAPKYCESLEELSDIQIKLEGLQSAAAAGARQRIVPESVAVQLGAMEHYLSKLVSEYEHSAQQGEGTIAVAAVPMLEAFTGKGGTAAFRAGYSLPYRAASLDVQSAIEADL